MYFRSSDPVATNVWFVDKHHTDLLRKRACQTAEATTHGCPGHSLTLLSSAHSTESLALTAPSSSPLVMFASRRPKHARDTVRRAYVALEDADYLARRHIYELNALIDHCDGVRLVVLLGP